MGISLAYRSAVLAWQARLSGRSLGVVRGVIRHGWHGNLSDRLYPDRWRILTDFGYVYYHDVMFTLPLLLYQFSIVITASEICVPR